MPCPENCSTITKERFMKPENQELREKMKSLKFTCPDCQVDLNVNNKGNVTGQHTDTCNLEVTFKCQCSHIFSGSYSAVKLSHNEHLKTQCTGILCPTTRKLMTAVESFVCVGFPEMLIQCYKAAEPFYFLEYG